MQVAQTVRTVLIGLAVILLLCALKNYVAFMVRGTAWCQYLCPSVFERQLVGDFTGLEQLFILQGWLRSSSQELFNHIFMDRWSVFGALIAAPVIEEVIYRGPMYLARSHSRHPVWWLTGLAVTILFALSHGRTGVALLPLLALGAYNLWLVASTRCIWPAFLLHFLYNFIFFSLDIYQSIWASD